MRIIHESAKESCWCVLFEGIMYVVVMDAYGWVDWDDGSCNVIIVELKMHAGQNFVN